MTILSDVKALGQQIWLDNLSRSLVQSGELAEMLKQGVCGVTSNPAIFQKAFAGDPLYADEVAALKQKNLTPKQRYETMATAKVWAKAIPNSGRLAKTVPVSTEPISRDNTKPSLASIATIKANSSKLSQPTKNQIILTERWLSHFIIPACKRLNITTDRNG